MEDGMAEDTMQTQQMLGRIEVKMENIGANNDKLSNKMDEVIKEVNNLKIDVAEIKAKQPAPEVKVSKWTVAATVSGFILAFGTLVTVAVILIPKFVP